ncbi:hypothetical protein HBE96_09680 [Clostridium sp. P21]|uniref:ABC-2 family transporter protein n=1 Tax=Clostridium muellerianum TaxID=2716538 RepID=A0A7Y0EGF1_9CLOT|nr:hypothetical protein [Clostridium muellerianum]NMM62968.1 hypothetical protein [Clostridium muellerianum]
MILNLFKFEMKKHFLIFSIFTLIELICGIAVLINYDYRSAAFLVSNVTWIVIPVYIFIDLYNEFYKGKEVITHMIPIKTSAKFLVKSLIFSLGLMIIWSTCLIYELFSLNGIYYSKIMDSSNPKVGVIYFILARFIGFIAGPIIIGMALALSKLVKNKILSAAIIVITITVTTVGLYLVMKSNLAGQEHIGWAIGTTSKEVFKQYAGMVSILVTSDKDITDIAQTIHWNNVIFNALVAVLGYGIVSSIFNSRKYEIIGK